MLVTSGPKSANQCSIRGKSVPSSARRAHMGWKSSSGVTAQKACLVKYGKMPPTPPKPEPKPKKDPARKGPKVKKQKA